VERAHRAAVGMFHAPGTWSQGERVELDATAAHHAMVKRHAVGDAVRISSGDGRRASGRIAELSRSKFVVALDDEPVEEIPVPSRVELWAPVGDRERMLMLAEKTTELGLASWRPIIYARSRSVSPRGEGEAFREKLRARQISALEQSGGAWLPESNVEIAFADAIADAKNSRFGMRLLLDPDGEPIADVARVLETPVCIALGPEGGLEESEREQFIRGGWRPVSLGTNVLRFETAGIAAVAIVRSQLR
jgi:16S rRNA (uracil1498-N3)-methyltransferase